MLARTPFRAAALKKNEAALREIEEVTAGNTWEVAGLGFERGTNELLLWTGVSYLGAVLLSVGFLPFALSNYFTLNLLGTALPGVLIVALVADMLLVPAMVELGLIPFASGGGEAPAD